MNKPTIKSIMDDTKRRLLSSIEYNFEGGFDKKFLRIKEIRCEK